jgi:hypothetical protein
MYFKNSAALAAVVLGAAAVLAACGDASKQNQLAYDACIKAAKTDAKVGSATFETYEKTQFGASTGDADIRVNLPYDLNGQKGVYQCIAGKQADGTYKPVF